MTDIIATNETILVVGGGISGMTAALEAAECGKDVILLEKQAALGGRVSQLYKYFPKLCRPSCGQEINQRRIAANKRLRVVTLAEIESVTGEAGNYTATITVKPRYVTENCTACGDCARAVTAEIDNPHNYNLSKIKAAYLPHNMAYPQRYVIDRSIVGTEQGEKAKAACRFDAVDLEMQEETLKINCGAVIFATGWRPYNAAKIQPYGYDRYANVITSVEFERMMDPYGPTGGKLLRPSDGKEAKDIAFIQCAGSRDRNHLSHCSRICCMASLKQSTYLGEIYGDDPDAKATIYYIDIRTIDRFEDFERKVRADERVHFIKSKVAGIDQDPKSGNPVVKGVDTHGYKRYANPHDLVVLAVGMEPSIDVASIVKSNDGAGAPGVAVDAAGFIELAPANRDPATGIFGAGCATNALDVNRSVQGATAAALRAIQVVNRVAASHLPVIKGYPGYTRDYNAEVLEKLGFQKEGNTSVFKKGDQFILSPAVNPKENDAMWFDIREANLERVKKFKANSFLVVRIVPDMFIVEALNSVLPLLSENLKGKRSNSGYVWGNRIKTKSLSAGSKASLTSNSNQAIKIETKLINKAQLARFFNDG